MQLLRKETHILALAMKYFPNVAQMEKEYHKSQPLEPKVPQSNALISPSNPKDGNKWNKEDLHKHSRKPTSDSSRLKKGAMAYDIE